MPVYLWLDIGSILIPFIFSFHPRLLFYREWRVYVPAILLTLLVYIAWDVWFTATGVWGFNPDYLVGIELFHLPLEEWLFFICIPYACLFTHHCISVLAPNWKLPSRTTQFLTYGLISLWVILTILFHDRTYSMVNFLWAIPLAALALTYHEETLSRFFVTYLVITVPFIIVNGMLTGALNPEPIVWYNDMENMGVRFFMPLEDYTYAFTMLLMPLLIVDRLRRSRTLTS